jgi:hypothetical protein
MSISESPENLETGSTWESLAPWEKAQEWREVAPDISFEVMNLARAYARAELEMVQARETVHGQIAVNQDEHKRLMEKRYWMLELFTTIITLVGLLGTIVLSALYLFAGYVVTGLAVVGVGGAASTGIYATGKTISTRSRSIKKNDEQEAAVAKAKSSQASQ